MVAEAMRGKLALGDLFSLFGLWVTFCMVGGFALGFWLIHQLSRISHPGWFRLNAVLAFVFGVVGYLYGANFTHFRISNFGESLIYTVVSSSTYVLAVLVIRWIYLGFAVTRKG